MIKAFQTGPGGDTIVCGLSWRNLDLLAYGKPIRFHTFDLGVTDGFDVWLVGGPTLPAIVAGLRQVGVNVPAGADQDGGLLTFFTRVGHPGMGPRAPVAIAAIGGDCDARLRAGEQITRELGPRRPRLRLLAGPDTDRLAEVITAGKPVLHRVDKRGEAGNA